MLVVGPSGAGKDTLIDAARLRFAGWPVHFARRIVTREASDAEAHDTLDRAAFAVAQARGDFAFTWQAHGLDYAIAASIEPLLAAGQAVVCNVSRAIVSELRHRFQRMVVVFVDAPLPVRLARIAERRRGTETPARAQRKQTFMPAEADCVIDNGGDLGLACQAFEAVLDATLRSIDADAGRPGGQRG